MSGRPTVTAGPSWPTELDDLRSKLCVHLQTGSELSAKCILAVVVIWRETSESKHVVSKLCSCLGHSPCLHCCIDGQQGCLLPLNATLRITPACSHSHQTSIITMTDLHVTNNISLLVTRLDLVPHAACMEPSRKVNCIHASQSCLPYPRQARRDPTPQAQNSNLNPVCAD